MITYPLPSGSFPSGNLLGSFLDQSVSLDLNAAGVTLQPGGQYFYSVTATSAGGQRAPQKAVVGGSLRPNSWSSRHHTTTSAQPGVGQSPSPSGGDDLASSGGSSSSSTPGLQSPGPGLGKTIKLEPLTNAEKLTKALKQCKKEPKRKRAACEKQAHQKYALVAQKSKKG